MLIAILNCCTKEELEEEEEEETPMVTPESPVLGQEGELAHLLQSLRMKADHAKTTTTQNADRSSRTRSWPSAGCRGCLRSSGELSCSRIARVPADTM